MSVVSNSKKEYQEFKKNTGCFKIDECSEMITKQRSSRC